MEQNLLINIYKNGEIIEFKTTLGTIVGSRKCTLNKKLDNSQETIIITAIEIKEDDHTQNNDANETLKEKKREDIFFNFECSLTKGYNFIHQKNTVFYRIISNNHLLYISNNVSAFGTFDSVSIPSYLLFPKFTIIFENYKHIPLLEIKTNKDEFLSKGQFDIQYSKKCRGVIINKSEIKLVEKKINVNDKSTDTTRFKYTFIDYLKSGVQINLAIAIDYTGSNGSPTYSSSLHYIKEGYKNDYQRVIEKCGNVVGKYDYDQMFPVWGFGGVPPGESNVSMCFPLDPQNEEIYTIENVSKLYREKTLQISFSGPTKFSPIIKRLNDEIISQNDRTKYQVFMILSDGIIDDMVETKEQLIIGSELPLSVIIVGIGLANFDDMDVLDADDEPLTYNGKTSKRDLVQFVPFREFQNDDVLLAKEVLAELPRQILEYYHMQNITPEDISAGKK